MVLVKIAKEFHWEMAHRLPYHKSGCQNLHGHSYRLWVELEGTPDVTGMVMDYADLKSMVKPLIDELDHCFLCSSDDQPMIEFFNKHPFKVVHVNFPTTAENLAGYFLGILEKKLTGFSNIRILRIRLSETLSSYADVQSILVRP